MRFFFFVKQKTAYEMRISDWSSDVCSSDLPPAGRIARLREGQRLERGEAGLAHLATHFLDQIQQHQRRLRLLHQDAVVLERAEAAFVEGLVEQALGRADRIGGVDDHDVDAARRAVGHVGDAVVEQQSCARVRSEEQTSELQSLKRN